MLLICMMANGFCFLTERRFEMAGYGSYTMNTNAPQGTKIVYCNFEPGVESLRLNECYTVKETGGGVFTATVLLEEVEGSFPCRLFRNKTIKTEHIDDGR